MDLNFHTFKTIESSKLISELEKRGVVSNWEYVDLHNLSNMMDSCMFVSESDILKFAMLLALNAKEQKFDTVVYTDIIEYTQFLAFYIDSTCVRTTYRIDSFAL